MKAKVTERGWPGHFICADRCTFRRNTLIEFRDIKIVVSTVGDMRRDVKDNDGFKSVPETIGYQRYYETMVFHAEFDGHYWDADIGREVEFESNWAISELYEGVDNEANEMHEAVVKEIAVKLEQGKLEEV